MTDERFGKLVDVIETATFLMKAERDESTMALLTRAMIIDIKEYFRLTTGRELEVAEAEELAKIMRGAE